MISGLYEVFKKWCEKGRVYIYSDPHFTYEDMDEEEKKLVKKFEYADNETQIKNINKYVTKQDTIVILGDIGCIEEVKKIRAGYKVVVMGNHCSSSEKLKQVFDEVYKGPVFISEKILLSHEPLRELDWCYNIHGHLHNIEEVDGDCFHETYCCVSANLIGYKPICLDQLCKGEGEFREKGIFLGNIKSIHRRTIDRRIEKLKNQEK